MDGRPLQETAGTRVKLQVGGDFCLSQADLMRPLLFIAGGIGITPIVSMLAHFADHVGGSLPKLQFQAKHLLD